jgi:PIN domain nuclease of toxin-antitoxin system
LLAVVHNEVTAKLGAAIDLLLKSPNEKVVSTASFWEIAVKHRLSKLQLLLPLERLPGYFQALGYELLAVDEHHAIADLANPPGTKDPFDRMLLAQCQVEGMRLVTTDSVLMSHALAWRTP